jgi:hypothetical protein
MLRCASYAVQLPRPADLQLLFSLSTVLPLEARWESHPGAAHSTSRVAFFGHVPQYFFYPGTDCFCVTVCIA